MTAVNPIIKDLSRELNIRVSRAVGDACKLVETDEERVAILIIALSSLFEATMQMTAEAIPSYRKLSREFRAVGMTSILMQGSLTEKELQPRSHYPGLSDALNDVTVALLGTEPMTEDDEPNAGRVMDSFPALIPRPKWQMNAKTFYVCQFCGFRSFHPYDLFSGYCQRCRRFGDEKS